MSYIRTGELQKKLEGALEEITVMKDTRQKQEKMIELVIEQRDTFKQIFVDQTVMIVFFNSYL